MLNNGIKILRDSEHIESKRTIIVSGLGRSGTTSITGALFNSNLNMVSENVVKRTLDDWGIGTSLDDKDTQSIRKEVIRRNSKGMFTGPEDFLLS